MNDKAPNISSTPVAPEALDENHIIAERREKLSKLRESGVAFPNDFVPSHLSADLHQHYDALSKEDLAILINQKMQTSGNDQVINIIQ